MAQCHCADSVRWCHTEQTPRRRQSSKAGPDNGCLVARRLSVHKADSNPCASRVTHVEQSLQRAHVEARNTIVACQLLSASLVRRFAAPLSVDIVRQACGSEEGR